MAEWNDPRTAAESTGGLNTATVGVPRAARDVGLRSYMLSVYNYMASGVLLTGIVAMLFANSSLINLIVNPATGQATPLFWIALFAPLAIVFALSFGINRFSARTAQALFWVYAALVGVQFSSLFLVYTAVDRSGLLRDGGGIPGAQPLRLHDKARPPAVRHVPHHGRGGIVRRNDDQPVPASPGFNLAISAIGVLVFAGLTVYDTQKIKSIYFAVAGNGEAMAKSAVIGALNLYLDFINMFLFLLRFMGNRR